ncbi:glycosyltransferase family 4 protein [Sphingomonas sp.]|uniref:glycosyltransferase family 4 protein n=1 Tax=Sphingomonas sp. TaxID=28214 RepID=UPI00389D4932
MIEGGKAGVPLRIKFISSHDPLNVQAFSGTVFHMGTALQQAMPDIELIRAARPVWFERFEKIVQTLTKGKHNPASWRGLNRYFARRLAGRWRGQRVVAITVVISSLAGELATSVPVIHVSDATFDLMRNFYANVACLSDGAAAEAEEAERRCILKSVHNSFSSVWAARSAVSHYGAPEANVSAISWGCNIADVPGDQVRGADPQRSVCKLLFLGADWIRKGGDVASAAAEILQDRGVAVQLDLVGSKPPESLQRLPWIRNHGFLSKTDPKQVAQLNGLIRDADFLFLPTHQDCTPMVFAEANAYGTPAVTRDVGGVADVVRDGKNGIVLPRDAVAADFADAIEGAWRDTESYMLLRENARREYEDRLNWRSWAKAMHEVIHRLAAENRV